MPRLSLEEQSALRRALAVYTAVASQENDPAQIFEDLFAALAAVPLSGTVKTLSIQDGAVTAAKLASALAAKLVLVSWGEPAEEADNVIEVTLQLTDAAGNVLAAQRVLELHVADAAGGDDSATATIGEAADPVGEILAGADTAAVRVRTDATGKVRLAVTEAAAESRFLEARPCYGSPMLDATAAAELEFA